MDYREAMAVLHGWLGKELSLVMSVEREVRGEPSVRVLTPRLHHGRLRLTDLGPQNAQTACFALPQDPPETGAPNEGGSALAFHSSVFRGAQWAAGCEGTVLRLRQGELEYEFILRAEAGMSVPGEQ